MKRFQKSSKLAKSLKERLQNYAKNAHAKLTLGGSKHTVAFSAATGAAIAMAPAAEGTIITSESKGFTPVTVNINDQQSYKDINISPGSFKIFAKAYTFTSGGANFKRYSASLGNLGYTTGPRVYNIYWAVDGGNHGLINRFAPGARIGYGDDHTFPRDVNGRLPLLRTRTRNGAPDPAYNNLGEWAEVSSGYAYAGFRIYRNPSPGARYMNGWAKIKIEKNNGNPTSLTVQSWAYEDNGDPIFAPVPEASELGLGLGLLALGAAGVRRHRKLKDKRTAESPQT